MSSVRQNLRVVIPRVFSNISALEIGHFFEYYDFGKVMGVDLFPRNHHFNKAVLYFEYWNQNEMVETLHEKIMAGRETRVMYDEPNYWNLRLNHRDRDFVVKKEKKTNEMGSNEMGSNEMGSNEMGSNEMGSNEMGLRILAAIGVVKTNESGARILATIRGGNCDDICEGIHYIYRELEEGEILEIPTSEKKTEVDSEIRKNYITENQLNNTDIAYSTIVECIVKRKEEIISTNKTYRSLLIDIWKSMPRHKIVQNSTFNFKLTNENGEKGYTWSSEINMSFQNKDAPKTLKEILNMVKVNKYDIQMSIKLKTGRVVCIKI